MTDGKNTLHQLLEQGQSPWIDNITRDMPAGWKAEATGRRGNRWPNQ